MPAVLLRDAGPGDAGRLDDGLRALAADLGDSYAMDAAGLARLCLGPDPAAHGLLAEADGTLIGLALYAPVVSTAKGGAGVYVSDLWVSAAARRQRLGNRLLGGVAARGRRRWLAVFLRLAVYHTSPGARAFYDRLGFREATGESVLVLAGPDFTALEETG